MQLELLLILSAPFVGNVSVPLLCVSALDDPVCTREAIPWDECRANHNIVLATTAHGGHLGFFQGITASKLWWVGAVAEFLTVLNSSSLTHKPRKAQDVTPHSSPQSPIDKSPFITLADDGMVAAARKDEVEVEVGTEKPPEEPTQLHPGQNSQENSSTESQKDDEITTRLKRSISQLSRQSNKSMWLLAYIAIISTCPLVGSLILIIFRRKLKNVLPASWLTRR